MSKDNGVRKSEEIVKGCEFLIQFTAAERAQLMSWLEELVSEGETEIDDRDPLASAFDILARYIHEADELPARAVQ